MAPFQDFPVRSVAAESQRWKTSTVFQDFPVDSLRTRVAHDTALPLELVPPAALWPNENKVFLLLRYFPRVAVRGDARDAVHAVLPCVSPPAQYGTAAADLPARSRLSG